MMNAKVEFINHTEGLVVECASITIGDDWDFDENDNSIEPLKKLLKIGYTPEDLEEFLNSLDFTYDSGYGGQELFGTIWYTDGTWSSRGEYDGSEWWQHNHCPKIPEELK